MARAMIPKATVAMFIENRIMAEMNSKKPVKIIGCVCGAMAPSPEAALFVVDFGIDAWSHRSLMMHPPRASKPRPGESEKGE